MIAVTFQASSITDLKNQLLKFVGQVVETAVVDMPPLASPSPVAVAPTAEKKRGRPASKKDDAPEPVAPAKVETPAPVVAAPPLGIATKQDVVELMTTITKLEGGTEKAIGILTSLGVKRISELKEDQYQAAVAACEALLKKK